MVLRYILFFLFISLNVSFAAIYTVSNMEQFRQKLQKARDGDIILVNPGTYKVESNQVIEYDITIRGLGITPNDVRFNSSIVGQAVFNIYTRRATIENLSIRSYEHGIEINQNEYYNNREPLEMRLLKLDIKSSAHGKSAIEIKDSKNATILIKDSKLESSIDTIIATRAGLLTVYNSNVKARQGGIGYGDTTTAAIHAMKADQLNVFGGYIQGEVAGSIGTRAIEIGNHVGHTSIVSACIHGGWAGVGIGGGAREKKIRMEKTTLQSYKRYGILYSARNSRVEVERSCLYGNIPVHDSQGSGAVRYHKNKHYHGNYWEDPAANLIVRGQRLDLAPINSCPPTNNCIYTEPPQYEYDFTFDGCEHSSGTVFENRLDGASGTANGNIGQDPDGQVCKAVKFDRPRARIKIPNLSDTLNKTATMTFWIKTTQIGNKRLWKSPAITGIERRAGVNDIFWGWISKDGKIGISMGNVHKSISKTRINDGKWHHVALSREDGTSKYQVYVNGVRERSGVFREEGFVLRTVSPENRYNEIGGTTVMYKTGEIDLSEEHVRQFVGSLDELKIFKRILTATEIQTIYNNEKAKKNYDGALRVCESCGMFDAWDTFRSINDRNISTKIANQDFNLTIASLDSSESNYQDFNGTVCARVEDGTQALSGWKKLVFLQESEKIATFKVMKANKGARAKLAWKKDKNLPCPLTNEDNSTKSTDNFAIRPQSFNIIAPTTISSGEDFNITFQGLDGTNANTSFYSETQGTSFEVVAKERNASCATGIFDVDLSSPWSFNNGEHRIENAYSEVGVVDINISDTSLTCNALFASVDCKDKNVTSHWNTDTDVPIGKANATISFTPHHFDISADFENVKGGDFTYLADLTGNELLKEMSAKLNLTINAKNAKGDTTQNYSFACYAKPSKIDIGYLHSPIAPSGRLTALIAHETNTSKSFNAPIGDILTLDNMPKTIFDSGNASLGVRINFDRNYSKPVNPFDMNISDINITDADNVKEANEAIGGEASFLYGRAKADELLRQLKDGGGTSNNTAYVNYEIYDTTLRTKDLHWLQNSMHWYRNALHVGTLWASDYGRVSAAAASRVNKTIPTNDYNIEITSVIGPFSASNPGISTISMISRGSDTETFKNSIHLEVNPWLWHTDTFNPKPYSPVGSCSHHPCFDVNIFSGREAPYSIESGDISGSDINVSEIRAQDIRESGVKVFR